MLDARMTEYRLVTPPQARVMCRPIRLFFIFERARARKFGAGQCPVLCLTVHMVLYRRYLVGASTYNHA